jgi:hypothetical protein
LDNLSSSLRGCGSLDARGKELAVLIVQKGRLGLGGLAGGYGAETTDRLGCNTLIAEALAAGKYILRQTGPKTPP